MGAKCCILDRRPHSFCFRVERRTVTGNYMRELSLYCPSCRELLYYDLELEGEMFNPGPDDLFQCSSCKWHGSFRELSRNPAPAAPAELDFQI